MVWRLVDHEGLRLWKCIFVINFNSYAASSELRTTYIFFQIVMFCFSTFYTFLFNQYLSVK
jgi:hypothetical protein